MFGCMHVLVVSDIVTTHHPNPLNQPDTATPVVYARFMSGNGKSIFCHYIYTTMSHLSLLSH